MPDVEDDLPENDPKQFSRDDVERRVGDWLDRLKNFFDENSNWATQQGWRVDNSGHVPMHEQLMQEYGVAPTQQPTLKVDTPQGKYALFKPKGLWMIGANGRIDLYTDKGAFIIIDDANNFDPPKWKIFRSDERREGTPYKPEILSRLI